MTEIPELAARIEALLFASDRPLSPSAIVTILGDEQGLDQQNVHETIGQLRQHYERRKGGFLLIEVAGGYEFRSRPCFADDILRLYQRRPAKLSQAAMETLAIIAYRQPCSKALVDGLRGVDSAACIRTLLQRDLVCPAGRAKQPGRPYLYKTSLNFLRTFGLSSLQELPPPEELDGQHEGQILRLADYQQQSAMFETDADDSSEEEDES